MVGIPNIDALLKGFIFLYLASKLHLFLWRYTCCIARISLNELTDLIELKMKKLSVRGAPTIDINV